MNAPSFVIDRESKAEVRVIKCRVINALEALRSIDSCAALISIPVFSRRSDSFLTPIQFAPFRSSDPTFISRSTYGTYLHYERSYAINVFLFGVSGSPGSGLTCRQKHQISHPDRRDTSRRFPAIAVKNHGDFSQLL